MPGATWTRQSNDPNLLRRPFYYTNVDADPTNADIVYAGTESFFKSMDGGKTFTIAAHAARRQPRHLDQSRKTEHHDPVERRRRQRLDRRRAHLVDADEPADRRDLRGGADEQFPYKLYGAQQDTGWPSSSEPAALRAQLRRSAHDAGARSRLRDRADHAAPGAPHIVYGVCKGQFDRMNLETGQEKNYWIGAQSLYGKPASAIRYRFQRVSPMAISPHDPERPLLRLAVPAPHRDGGDVGEDLARPHGASRVLPGDQRRADHARRHRRGVLQHALRDRGVAAREGRDLDRLERRPVHVTRDNGKTWTNVTPKDLPPGGRVQYIDASPHRKGSALLRVYRYLLGDFEPYIYRTDDYGKTWTRLTDGKNGIPPTSRRASSARIRTARACSTRAPSSGCSSRSTAALAAVPAESAGDAGDRHQGLPRRSDRLDHGPQHLDSRQRDGAPSAREGRRCGSATLLAPPAAYRLRYDVMNGPADPQFIEPGAIIDYALKADATREPSSRCRRRHGRGDPFV